MFETLVGTVRYAPTQLALVFPFEHHTTETNIALSQEPVIMSAAWSNRSGGTVIARHEWKGLSKLRYKLEDWLQKGELEARDSPPLGRRRPGLRERRHVPGSYSVSDDDDSDWVEG